MQSIDPQLRQDLQLALTHSQLRVVYQPQIDIATRQIVGVEALMRWHHPTRGEISPREFIPIAEQNGLIHELGTWILKQACLEIQQQALKGNNLSISVHISPIQVIHADFYQFIASILAQTKLKPKQLILKLVKINLTQDMGRFIFAIQELRALGVAIALSDSGLYPDDAMGYRLLDLLEALPIDLLKLQPNLVQQIACNPEMEVQFYTIVNLAKRLNIPFIAEGVETADQIEFLSWHGCRILQGYWYARPSTTIELSKSVGRAKHANHTHNVENAHLS